MSDPKLRCGHPVTALWRNVLNKSGEYESHCGVCRDIIDARAAGLLAEDEPDRKGLYTPPGGTVPMYKGMDFVVCKEHEPPMFHAIGYPCPLCAAIAASPMTAREIVLREELAKLDGQLADAKRELAAKSPQYRSVGSIWIGGGGTREVFVREEAPK